MFDEKVYQRIRQRRNELGLTQSELAEKLGYTSYSTIAKIEAGKVDLSGKKLVDFANALNMTYSELIGFEDDGNVIFHYRADTVPASDIVKNIESGTYSIKDLAKIIEAATKRLTGFFES